MNYDVSKIVAVIPARGGSKSIPQKNLREFNNKPLICWTIDLALKVGFKRVIVSTDCAKIAAVALSSGAEVPYLRSAELAGDRVAIEPVLIDLVEVLSQEDDELQALALLMPTQPFRTLHDIQRGVEQFRLGNSTSVISVSPAVANHNPEWMLKMDQDQVVLYSGDSLLNIKDRRQDLSPCFIRNDYFYIFDICNLFHDKPNLYGGNPSLVIFDDNRLEVDINNERDWVLAEMIYRYQTI